MTTRDFFDAQNTHNFLSDYSGGGAASAPAAAAAATTPQSDQKFTGWGTSGMSLYRDLLRFIQTERQKLPTEIRESANDHRLDADTDAEIYALSYSLSQQPQHRGQMDIKTSLTIDAKHSSGAAAAGSSSYAAGAGSASSIGDTSVTAGDLLNPLAFSSDADHTTLDGSDLLAFDAATASVSVTAAVSTDAADDTIDLFN